MPILSLTASELLPQTQSKESPHATISNNLLKPQAPAASPTKNSITNKLVTKENPNTTLTLLNNLGHADPFCFICIGRSTKKAFAAYLPTMSFFAKVRPFKSIISQLSEAPSKNSKGNS